MGGVLFHSGKTGLGGVGVAGWGAARRCPGGPVYEVMGLLVCVQRHALRQRGDGVPGNANPEHGTHGSRNLSSPSHRHPRPRPWKSISAGLRRDVVVPAGRELDPPGIPTRRRQPVERLSRRRRRLAPCCQTGRRRPSSRGSPWVPFRNERREISSLAGIGPARRVRPFRWPHRSGPLLLLRPTDRIHVPIGIGAPKRASYARAPLTAKACPTLRPLVRPIEEPVDSPRSANNGLGAAPHLG